MAISRYELGGVLNIGVFAGIASLIKHVYIDNAPNDLFHTNIKQHIGDASLQIWTFFSDFTILQFFIYLFIYFIPCILLWPILLIIMNKYTKISDKITNYKSNSISLTIDLFIVVSIFFSYTILLYYIFRIIFI